MRRRQHPPIGGLARYDQGERYPVVLFRYEPPHWQITDTLYLMGMLSYREIRLAPDRQSLAITLEDLYWIDLRPPLEQRRQRILNLETPRRPNEKIHICYACYAPDSRHILGESGGWYDDELWLFDPRRATPPLRLARHIWDAGWLTPDLVWYTLRKELESPDAYVYDLRTRRVQRVEKARLEREWEFFLRARRVAPHLSPYVYSRTRQVRLRRVDWNWVAVESRAGGKRLVPLQVHVNPNPDLFAVSNDGQWAIVCGREREGGHSHAYWVDLQSGSHQLLLASWATPEARMRPSELPERFDVIEWWFEEGL